ncbi:protease inhibitor I42 family protein [Nonomuraea pusilla]|uniref:Chagasin family peptidase inhibitor I42 n=1 Tax=Nonomuraea pusilla TaxID=46177 RepID=A0A1H7KUE5_9ACTN|nr:protease inhibitor I42 family protein [Nonomuraea pusilla]SEK90096.1 Chagasin family peptidase inhibitor I42 [Nonomuraea pusilla]
MKRRTAVAAALLASALTGCGAGSAVNDLGTVAKGAKGSTVRVEVRQGDRFSLAVAENASVGDHWSLEAVPDAKVASYISKEYRSDGGGTGSGGTSYFVFNAKHAGTAEIRLRDCWRCGGAATPATEESRRESGEALFQVTVK